MEMIKIKEAVIVEGKYDKIKLSKIIDAPIITTEGFGIFNDKEKQNFIRKLAETRGLVVLTDSDSAGFLIRKFLGGSIKKEYIKNVYIPEIAGKEKRKENYSAEGILGVEGIPMEVLVDCLSKAGVICENENPVDNKRRVTKTDLFTDGFFGTPDCTEKRSILLKKLSLPQKLSTNSLVEMINIFMTYDEYRLIVKEIEGELK